MKLNRIILMCLLSGTMVLAGCSQAKTDKAVSGAPEQIEGYEADKETINAGSEDSENASDNSDNEEISDTDITFDDEAEGTEVGGEFDFEHDYVTDIKADVDSAVASASSLKEELESIDKIEKKYEATFSKAENQAEMSAVAFWYYQIWDAELNSLWSRFSDSADAETKERVLKGQRAWNSMKEEVILENLGPRDEGGSIYPQLENSLLEEFTKNRCYIIAVELGKIKGENVTMPERSEYGTYVDDQESGSVCSSLVTSLGWENDNVAKISIFRLGETEGNFTSKGNGELAYTSYEGDVEGIIRLNGWDGASFEVTKSDGSPFTVGDKYEFNFVF
ncbi:Protein of unknown function [Lachnospiraceae bacterium]|nr:Protein of unknown function [Lachnospiraceae bacterium]